MNAMFKPETSRVLMLTAIVVVVAAVPLLGQMDWKKLSPATIPPARAGHAMAYHAARQRVVLFGGSPSYSLNKVWEWDGMNWTHRTPAMNLVQQGFATAYDSARGAILIFGGATPLADDTWVYTPTDLTASSHVVWVTSGGTITLTLNAGSTNAGKSYFVAGCMDSGSPRGMSLGNVTLLLNPDGYFWFMVYFPNNNFMHVKTLGTLDGSGKATAVVKVPTLPPALIGTPFYHAYIVFKTGIDYASTPVPLTFGP
jgi:hypothetical protein